MKRTYATAKRAPCLLQGAGSSLPVHGSQARPELLNALYEAPSSPAAQQSKVWRASVCSLVAGSPVADSTHFLREAGQADSASHTCRRSCFWYAKQSTRKLGPTPTCSSRCTGSRGGKQRRWSMR